MALIIVFLLCFVPLLIIFYEISRRKRYPALPPGPTPISVLGNITEFLKYPSLKHEKLAELSAKYGDVMTVWFLTKPVVILSSVDAVRKAYIEKQHDFASRPDTILSAVLFDGYDLDVAFGYYTPRWAAKRRLLHGSVRQLAGSQRLETESIASLEQVIAKMLRHGEEAPIDMRHYIVQAVYNMVMILVFGKRFDLDDPEFLKFCEFHQVEDEAISATRYYDMLPFLHGIAESVSPTLRRMKRIVRVYQNYVLKWFDEAEPAEGEIEYMTQAFKKGLTDLDSKGAEKSAENGAQDYQEFSHKEILAMLMDMFTASTSTTTSAITWFFLEMILHPEIQEKCYNELLEVIGPDGTVSLSHRKDLPYLEACILETLRFHSPVSLNVPHTPPNDAILGDYKIPAGTDTILNIWAIHHNPSLWKDADHFNPDNFLDNNGNVSRPAHLFTFGAGRRVCLGEAFAKNSLFLTFAIMLQRLRFERVDGHQYTLERSEASGDFINVPKPYMLSIHQRKE